jgi:hypothetical protein
MLNPIAELLQKYKVREEDLNSDERATLERWAKSVSQTTLNVEAIKDFNESLITAIEKDLAELTESTTFWHVLFHRKRDIYLKARLKERLMMRNFLQGPEKARKWLEQSLQNLK